MKAQSLRAQLCVWHAGLLGLTLIALAGLTYFLLNQVLHSRADAGLREYADVTARGIATTLYRSEGLGLPGGGGASFLTNDIRSWGRYVQIIDPQGNLREVSDGLASHPLPVSAEALRAGQSGRIHFETVSSLGEHPVRIVTVPVRMGERIPFLVQAGLSLEGVDAALQRALWILLILTPAAFVIALAGGWMVVGRALRPVDELTRTALEIQGTNLQRRIQHPEANDEIGRLARAFDQMIGRLDRSFQQVRQFSADASHELKTPLTAIRGEAEVALMGERPPDEYRRSIRSILESAERMSEIVESLLLLARADSGDDLIRKEPVELGELLLGVVDRLEGMSAQKGVALSVEEMADLVVEGDALWLSQIATNLVTNGLKYTPAGGRVTVRLRRSGDSAEFSVHDTGVGIPAEHLARIFDRFYRVDHGRTRAEGGSGLGLSITRWAVEAHGGEISVESHPGQGSLFRVRLPLAAGAEEDEEWASESLMENVGVIGAVDRA